jgi:hypothetical protein
MIDFVYQLILGFDYPGLTKALDPITIGLLVGTGVQQIGKAVEAGQQKRAAERQMRKGQDLYDKLVQDFQQGKFDVKLSQDVRDAAEQQRILAEQVSDAAAERGEAQIQSALAATRYGDARSAALIPGQLRQVEAGVQQAELAGLGQKVAADAALAAQQQRVADQNASIQQQLAAMQLQRGAGAMDAGQLAAQQARQAQIQAITGAASTLAQGLAAGGAQRAQANNTDPGSSEVSNLFRALEAVPSGSDALINPSGSGMAGLGTQLNFDGTLNLDGDPTNSMESGGQYEFADKGGEVHMTKGEFDHSTNKKALIDEETGEKEAELTGDEAMVRDGENVLVFNPEQQDTIEKLVNEGDAKGLLKKMKALMKQFENQNG